MSTEKTWILRSAIALPLLAAFGTAMAATTDPAPALQPAPESSMTLTYLLMAVAVVQVIFILSLNGIMRTMSASGRRSDLLKSGIARTLAVLALLCFTGSNASAQAYRGDGNAMSNDQLTWVLICVNIFLFLAILVQVNLLRGMIRGFVGEGAVKAAPAPTDKPSWMQGVMRRLTRQVPMVKEQELLLHHEYDGIRELDNVLPPWWVWLFYGTIVWSVVYLLNVHVLNIWPTQKQEYVAEMAQAKADQEALLATQASQVDERTVTRLSDASALAQGKGIFTQNCATCHGQNAEGIAGPNLTDAYWLHGGGVRDLFTTVKYGVTGKAMKSWKDDLKPTEIQAVVSYVLSLQGSQPANPKAAEGELWQAEGSPTDSTATDRDTATAAAADTTRLSLR